MKIHLLCEGNPETRDSWSGSSRSVLTALRAAGHAVTWSDVELKGISRWVAALSTFSPDRKRWWSRYHLAALPFQLRSKRARRSLAAYDTPDVILQIGATFRIAEPPAPLVLYCDSNIQLAQQARVTGYGEAVVLADAEVSAITGRERSVYDSAMAILTLSDLLRRSFLNDFQLPPERLHTIHAGPNLMDHVDRDVLSEARARRRAAQAPTILFVGRQFERKGGDLLLRAFQNVRKSIPNARLVVVGPEHIEDVDAPTDGVVNLGFLNPDLSEDRERLQRAYLESDVFCLPTRFEPFGIVFVEAMLYGLPCVGPDAWAVPEMIEDGVTGLLFPPEDEEALADRILSLLRAPGVAKQMGEAGRTAAESYFTWPATIERMTSVLNRVVTENEWQR